eukprot:gb/GEZJ01000398.1/.p2 GENE.gb/GEZJ01000398.1/~~gb/GEZJ01000398.1/.p2  ORF type:complete len:144 (+),score=25.33 gb/GEZJ01000398.1/:186-617(+)
MFQDHSIYCKKGKILRGKTFMKQRTMDIKLIWFAQKPKTGEGNGSSENSGSSLFVGSRLVSLGDDIKPNELESNSGVSEEMNSGGNDTEPSLASGSVLSISGPENSDTDGDATGELNPTGNTAAMGKASVLSIVSGRTEMIGS